MPTEVPPRLDSLPGIRAVIFDIYGTLIISGSGDVGHANDADPGTDFTTAITSIAPEVQAADLPTLQSLRDSILATNRRAISAACPKPEVDIVDQWRMVFRDHGLKELAADVRRMVQVAALYESRSNPTWPMPGASKTLSGLRSRGQRLGIVSNAQIFTIDLVEDLIDRPLGETFDFDLSVFSNRFRQAKPGPRLFEVLCDSLRRAEITPAETLYVGNDMLNDVWAAGQAGIRTAWFVGDARSCRQRLDDHRCESLQADLVLTELPQLIQCLT